MALSCTIFLHIWYRKILWPWKLGRGHSRLSKLVPFDIRPAVSC